MAPKYWEAFEKSEVLALNRTGYSETPSLVLGNHFVASFSVSATRNTKPF